METVSRAQSARDKEGKADATFQQIERYLSDLSKASVITPDYRLKFPDQSQAIEIYLSKLRDAVTSSQAGYDIYAEQILRESLTSEFSQGLSTLGRYWNCERPESSAPLEMADSHENTAFDNAPASPIDAEPQKPMLSVSGNIAMRSPLPHRGTLRPAKINARVPLEINILALVSLALFAILAALYFVNRRPKKREARRLVQTPVIVRLDQRQYDLVMVDITRNGFKLQHKELIEKQRKLQIYLNGAWHSGQIKWANTGFAGVMFSKPISPQTFDSVVAASLGH